LSILKSKFIVLGFLLPLFVYLSLYTWNWRTGYLDRFAANTGLEIVGWILAPGKWLHAQAELSWKRYVALTGVREENEQLRRELEQLKLRAMRLESRAEEAERLRRLLRFSPPPDWSCQGARIIGHKLGPNALLQTLLINKGKRNRISKHMPVLTSKGLVGRVLKVSPHFSSLLLLTDPNNHVPVLAQETRTKGILQGRGPGSSLAMKYVGQNAPLHTGETLVTSGMGNVFPKGLPVARITSIEHSSLYLFQKVTAEPLVDFNYLEEVLLLQRMEAPPADEATTAPEAQ
jgi:rod shape-determining protein MreC